MDAQYIHLDSVRTALQVIVVMTKCGDKFEFARPAALSTDDPNRNVGGNWKTPLCRRIEEQMQQAQKPPMLRP